MRPICAPAWAPRWCRSRFRVRFSSPALALRRSFRAVNRCRENDRSGMHLLTAAILLSWMIALAWTVPTLIALSNLPRVPNLLEMPLPDAGFETGESGSAFRPELTVIVPARNEAQSIEQTLQSL